MKQTKLIFLIAVFFLLTNSLKSQPPYTFRVDYSVALFDIIGGVAEKDDGNFLMGGYSIFSGHLIEIDTIGAVMWGKSYGNSQIYGLTKITTNSYIATGSTGGFGTGLMLMKLDGLGNAIWGRRYVTTSGGYEGGNKVISTSDGGFLSVGYVFGHNTQDSASFYMVKTNATGTLLWDKVMYPKPAVDNDDVLYDVTEVSDGYIAVGKMSDQNVDPDNGGGDSGILLKTDFNGNTQWVKKLNPGGNSTSEALYGITTLSNGNVLVTGHDNSKMILLEVNSSTGNMAAFKFSYEATGLVGASEGNSVFVTNDGKYGVAGLYITGGLFPDFNTFLLKIEPSNGNPIFKKSYNGLPITPKGMQTSDNGYLVAMSEGFNYHVLKTDPTGGLLDVACLPGDISDMANSAYSPSFTTITPPEYTGTAKTNYTPSVSNLSPSAAIDCQPLPIELLSFTGYPVDEGVKLEWTTISEINNDYFTIYRSKNGYDFEEIGRVQGAGNYNGQLDYQLIDEDPYVGQSYYRLKQTDFDGAYEYFNIIHVFVEELSITTIYPNPSKGDLQVIIYAVQNTSAVLEIVNAFGQVVSRENYNIEKGKNKIMFDISKYAVGLYTFKVLNIKGDLTQQKFVKN